MSSKIPYIWLVINSPAPTHMNKPFTVCSIPTTYISVHTRLHTLFLSHIDWLSWHMCGNHKVRNRVHHTHASIHIIIRGFSGSTYIHVATHRHQSMDTCVIIRVNAVKRFPLYMTVHSICIYRRVFSSLLLFSFFVLCRCCNQAFDLCQDI